MIDFTLEIYWSVFTTLCIIYNVWSYKWIKKNNGLDKKTKLIVTISCMVFLSIVAGKTIYDAREAWWKWFVIAFQSLVLWATVVDGYQGLRLHHNPFYMGRSWPDSIITKYVMNGYLYALFKYILLMFAFSFNFLFSSI